MVWCAYATGLHTLWRLGHQRASQSQSSCCSTTARRKHPPGRPVRSCYRVAAPRTDALKTIEAIGECDRWCFCFARPVATTGRDKVERRAVCRCRCKTSCAPVPVPWWRACRVWYLLRSRVRSLPSSFTCIRTLCRLVVVVAWFSCRRSSNTPICLC